MKRLTVVLALLLLLAPLRPAAADVASTDPLTVLQSIYPAQPLPSPLEVYANLGALQLTVPGQAFRLIALYDFVGKRPLAGAETVLGVIKVDRSSSDPWDIDLTAGAVTDETARGAPILGINLAKLNPTGQLISIANLKIGVFGGYNANAGNGSSKPIMAGAKMAYEMRFWATPL